VEDVVEWLERWPITAGLIAASERPALRVLARALRGSRPPGASVIEAARAAFTREVATWQAADVAHWRPVIDELRELRRDGELLELGSPVA
jgi:hypothetical protein